MVDEIPLSELETAIREDQLKLLYQPQVSNDGRRLVAVEALVRWDHPEYGRLGPHHFIPAADRSGLIEPLGEWVLRRACADALRWPGLGVSVNVSPLQFRRPGFVDEVEKIIHDSGAPFNQIELEIVETAFFDDPLQAETALPLLREMGLKIALDDFGSGYSSIAYLRRLPFDKVKIDKSFIDDIQSPNGAAIVHAMIVLAKALGMTVTAEGVETSAQQQLLRAAGCHYLQGFLFPARRRSKRSTRYGRTIGNAGRKSASTSRAEDRSGDRAQRRRAQIGGDGVALF